jgi:catechol 2,3-dioxygenase-like lactoylglutathione lyase family enzyme
VTTFALQRLDHVSLNVRDRAGSIAWYVETLGLDQKNEPTADDEPVFLGAFGACIALFQAASDPGPREHQTVS